MNTKVRALALYSLGSMTTYSCVSTSIAIAASSDSSRDWPDDASPWAVFIASRNLMKTFSRTPDRGSSAVRAVDPVAFLGFFFSAGFFLAGAGAFFEGFSDASGTSSSLSLSDSLDSSGSCALRLPFFAGDVATGESSLGQDTSMLRIASYRLMSSSSSESTYHKLAVLALTLTLRTSQLYQLPVSGHSTCMLLPLKSELNSPIVTSRRSGSNAPCATREKTSIA